MGAGNVKLVYACWRDLPHAPFRALAYMAVVSLDDDAPPLFYAGREALALALGRLVPPEDDDNPAVTAERRAAFRAVDRVLRELIERGAIKIDKLAAPGRNAHYALNLTIQRSTPSVVRSDHAKRGPSSRSGRSNGPRSAASTDHGERHQRTTVSGSTDHGERGPEEYEEDGGLTRGKKKADRRNGGTGSARAREGDDHDDSSITQQSDGAQDQKRGDDQPACGDCGTMLDPDGSCFACVSAATWRSA